MMLLTGIVRPLWQPQSKKDFCGLFPGKIPPSFSPEAESSRRRYDSTNSFKKKRSRGIIDRPRHQTRMRA
jgi:hypothetical protein